MGHGKGKKKRERERERVDEGGSQGHPKSIYNLLVVKIMGSRLYIFLVYFYPMGRVEKLK